ncbi:integrase, partial [Escherichia coli]|nr:integrase [Escherichia coli]EAB6056599.1 integrase [Escherichia coli]EAC0113103.1 integrase [Escherichia coli]EEV5829966.1 integrase [Escherichia coli]EEV6732876.1 integrase [Escherichia coli]
LATLALQILKLTHWFRPSNRFRPEEQNRLSPVPAH